METHPLEYLMYHHPATINRFGGILVETSYLFEQQITVTLITKIQARRLEHTGLLYILTQMGWPDILIAMDYHPIFLKLSISSLII